MTDDKLRRVARPSAPTGREPFVICDLSSVMAELQARTLGKGEKAG
jgi:hypothetical protein